MPMDKRLWATLMIVWAFLAPNKAQTTALSGLNKVMDEAYYKQWNDTLQQRIDRDIDRYRKADATIHIANLARKGIVKVEQVSHDYLFGGNTFLFGQLPTTAQNETYEHVFGRLFNAATVAFYWKTLEPLRGHPRFEADASYVYRRPPTDPVVDFCNRKGININGHAIIYGLRLHGHPTWMPQNRDTMEYLFKRHIRQLADRYGNRVQRWDVVNERFDQANRGLMPDDYMYKAYRWAMDYFPPDVQLNTNECDMHWGPTPRYVEIVRDLIDRGIRVDNVGLQMHIFDPAEAEEIAQGQDKYLRPEQMYATLDTLSRAERPIHISEVTVCAPDSTARGQAIQATIARNLYRLCFSYPTTMGITWWNMVDGGAAKGEPSYSGLFDKQMQKKPVYAVLDELINKEWHTSMALFPAKDGTMSFRGYKGKYRISWTDKSGKKHVEMVHLSKNGSNFELK